MSSVRLLLGHVMDITPSSVLFSTGSGDSLNFQTLSTIPKAHRESVRRNGLVAKVMLSATSKTSNWRTQEERLRIWWSALTSSGLIEPNANAVTAPANLGGVLWPIIDNEALTTYTDLAMKHQVNVKLNECPYIAAVLYVQQIFYKVHDVKGTLCVVWMPRYKHNLAHWTMVQLPRRFVPESVLYKLVCNIINALILLCDVCVECPACIFMDDILVGETSGAEPIFVLNIMSVEQALKWQQTDSSASAALLLAPELLLQPRKLITNSVCSVWSLGMIAYLIASGMPSEESKAHLMGARHATEKVVLNHHRLMPSDIVVRVRAVLQAVSYSNAFIHLVLLMLGQDPNTRPTLHVVCDTLRDIMRFKPVFRFPFAIGPFTLVHLWSEDRIVVDTVKRRYDTEATCAACKKSRVELRCVEGEHTSALCSPPWSMEEPLPGYAVASQNAVTYLYPMLGKLDKKAQRQYIDTALRGSKANKGGLLQLLGGFAMLKEDKGKPAVARDVLVPLPHGILQREDKISVATELNFTASLPWPSQCTSKLQKEGRIQWSVPGLFGFTNAHWYAWILPGEKLEIDGEPWTPAPDGAFVFWFNESLQPSEYDRYFVVCSVLSLTWQAKMSCNVLPDQVFKRRGDTESLSPNNGSEGGLSSCATSNHCDGSTERQTNRDANAPSKVHRGALEQHSVNSMLNLPKVGEIQELKGNGVIPARRHKNSNVNVASSSLNSCDSENLNVAHRKCTRRNSTTIRMDYVEDVTPGIIVDDMKEPTVHRQSPQRQQRDAAAQHQSNSTDGIISVLHRSEEGMGCSTPREPPRPRERTQCRPASPQEAEAAVKPRPRPPSAPPQRRPRPNGDGKFAWLPNGVASPSAASKTPSSSHSPGRPASAAAVDVNRTLSPKESAVLQHSRTVFPVRSSLLHVFGRWHPPTQIDAPFKSLTFCTLATGEHGTLSPPVMLSMAVRLALHVPAAATHMAFAASIVPLICRNHPKGTAALGTLGNSARYMIPHHGLVFYGEKEETVGFMALRFALTNSSHITAGEMLLPTKLLPPVVATATFVSQLNAAYITDGAAPAVGGGDALRHSEIAGKGEILSSVSKRVTTSWGRFGTGDEPPMKLAFDGDEVLPFCWIGFENESRMLMISDAQRLSWYPLYFSDE